MKKGKPIQKETLLMSVNVIVLAALVLQQLWGGFWLIAVAYWAFVMALLAVRDIRAKQRSAVTVFYLVLALALIAYLVWMLTAWLG